MGSFGEDGIDFEKKAFYDTIKLKPRLSGRQISANFEKHSFAKAHKGDDQ